MTKSTVTAHLARATCAFALIATLSINQARAQLNNYTFLASGTLYSEPNSWEARDFFGIVIFGGGPPPPGHQVIYRADATYTVNVDISANNNSDFFNAANAHVTLDITGPGYTTGYLGIGTNTGSSNSVSVSGSNLAASSVEIAPSLGQGVLSLGSPMQASRIAVGGIFSFAGFLAETPRGQGTLTLNAGANLTVPALLAYNVGAGSSIVFNGGTLTITGDGRFNNAAATTFAQVGDGTHTAVLNLQNGLLPGQFSFRSADTLTVATFASINFDSPGGSLTVGDIHRNIGDPGVGSDGIFNWVAGHIRLANAALEISSTGQFGANLDLTSDRTLSVSGPTTIASGALLMLSGGSLVTESISTAGGQFTYINGILQIDNGNLPIDPGASGLSIGESDAISLPNGSLTLAPGQTVEVNGGSLAMASLPIAGEVNFVSGNLQLTNDDLTLGPTGEINVSTSFSLNGGSSIQLDVGTLTIQPTQALEVTGGSVRATTVVSNSEIEVSGGGEVVARTMILGGPGGTGSIKALIDGLIKLERLARNHLIVDGGTVIVEFDPEGGRVDPVLDGSIVGGYTHDSAMTMHAGIVSTPNMKIGVTPGFTDTVTINGGTLTTDNLLAAGGAGSILIFNGGTINTGHSEVDGPSTLVVGNGSTDARLNLTGAGTHNFADDLAISASGHLTGNGAITGNVTSDGRIAPSVSGTIDISGTLANTGKLEFDIEPIPVSETGVILVSGEINVGGSFDAGGVIEVNLLPIIGYDGTPELGATFVLMNFTSITNSGYTFDFTNAALPAGRMWDTSAFTTTGMISVVAGLAGDFNQNSTVDAADYVIWRKTDGTAAGYNTWCANFSQTIGSGSVASANATVPEPTTLVMLIVAAVGIRLWRCQIA